MSEFLKSMTQVNDGLHPSHHVAKLVSVWRPPRAGLVKIKSDASFIAQTGRVFGGYILRDQDGKWLLEILTEGLQLMLLWPK